MTVIALTETYTAAIHGRTHDTSPGIEGRRLVLDTYDPTEFSKDPSLAVACLSCLLSRRLPYLTDPKLELVDVERLEGNEDVSVQQPCPIAQFQRRWRKVR